jgi:hypothetical protein
MTAEDPIDGSRYANGESLETPRERTWLIRLDEKVEMIMLDRKVKEPEGRSGGGTEGRSHAPKQTRIPEGGQAGLGAQGDVRRTALVVDRPPAVRDGAPPWARRTAGSATLATPGAEREVELSAGGRHLELGTYYIKLARLSSYSAEVIREPSLARGQQPRGARAHRQPHRASAVRPTRAWEAATI